jgi:hypothetical protein
MKPEYPEKTTNLQHVTYTNFITYVVSTFKKIVRNDMDGNENDKQPKFTQIKRWETFMLFYISQVASAIISIIHTLFIIIVVKQSLTCSWGILFTSVKDVYIVKDIYIYVLASVNNSYETIVLVGLQNHPVHTLMTSLVKIG